MEESILVTIKKMLGLDVEYTPFDTDVIVLINSALMTLMQANVGPKHGFYVHGISETWSDFLTNPVMLEGAKEYVYLRVRIVFDPPSSGTVMEAMKQTIQELIWRLIVQAESVENFDFIAEGYGEGSGGSGKKSGSGCSGNGSGSGQGGSGGGSGGGQGGGSDDGGGTPPEWEDGGIGPLGYVGPREVVHVGAGENWPNAELPVVQE